MGLFALPLGKTPIANLEEALINLDLFEDGRDSEEYRSDYLLGIARSCIEAAIEKLEVPSIFTASVVRHSMGYLTEVRYRNDDGVVMGLINADLSIIMDPPDRSHTVFGVFAEFDYVKMRNDDSWRVTLTRMSSTVDDKTLAAAAATITAAVAHQYEATPEVP